MDALDVRSTKFNIYDLLILLLIVGVILSNYIWLKTDEYPVDSHELIGLIPAVQAYRELKGIGNTDKNYDQILGLYHGFLAYPPLSFLVVVLFYILFGLQGQMVVMVNSIYIAITLFCIYLIGKNIFNKPTGLLAAFILSSFPGFIGFSRIYWIEFGLMAYVSLDLYLLLKTNFFENRKYSILLGISLALSFLHKYEFILFIIGPLLLVIYKSEILKDILQAKWSKKLTNITLTLSLTLCLSSFWWLRYGKYVLNRMFFAARSVHELHEIDKIKEVSYIQSILSSESLTFYLYSLISLITDLFFIILFLSLVSIMIKIIINQKNRFHILFIFLSFIIPYIIFNFLIKKSSAHILSILPSIAILISASIYFLKNKFLRFTLTGLICIYSINLHSYSFYYHKDPQPLLFNFIKIKNEFLEHFKWKFKGGGPWGYVYLFFNPPRKERLEFAIKEILDFIKADSISKEHPGVFVIFNREAFKNCTFEYYSLIWDYKMKFSSCYHPFSEISECDYVIIEKFEEESIAEILLRGYSARLNEISNFKKIFKDGIKDFELIKIYKIPNGDVSIFIYKRKDVF